MHRRKHSRTKHGGSTHFLRPLRTTEHRMHCQYREKNEYHEYSEYPEHGAYHEYHE